jgi:DNA polymerase III subunit epsilon
VKPDRRLLAAMLAPGTALALWLALGVLLLWATLDAEKLAAVGAAIGPLVETHGALLAGWFLVAAALGAWAAWRLYQAHVTAPARLADATRVLVGNAAAPDPVPQGSAATRELAAAIAGLAGERRALQADLARLVDEASRRAAEQRDQLGALIAELNQSVLVCNLEGQILLYNERARALFRRLSPHGAGGIELIGLGRSIYAVIDRALIDHARETVEGRIARGGAMAIAARFVTATPAGHLLRVSLAPVRSAAAEGAGLTGFVLLLDDITVEHEADLRRDQHLLDLTHASRASVASMQAALDMLDYPDLDGADRERFLAVVRDEVGAMGARLSALDASASQDQFTRWQLQEMLGADLVAAARRRIEADTGQPVTLDEIDENLWLSVDSFGLIRALAFLAGRLAGAFDRPPLWLRAVRARGRAHLDLGWSDADAHPRIAPETKTGWQAEPMETGDDRTALTVRDVAERHGGEVWLERDRSGGRSYFRFLLPLAPEEAPRATTIEGARPEFYDFDLFAAGEGSRALDDRPLAELAYTIFDTETTGLDPTGGDEIIQIGATRIVNGRILRGECFDQLVDPGRSIPEVGIPIHGIRPEMVRGQPSIAEALPVFHAFVADSVLVGHNVAFDMRFLKLKEYAIGVRFDQPVLDTLLLSSVVHPNEPAHALEAIAARLGVTVTARHSAAGDALTTAEVFLKLLPLLRERGIVTLGQAQAAARQSQFARLRY